MNHNLLTGALLLIASGVTFAHSGPAAIVGAVLMVAGAALLMRAVER